MIKEIQTAKCQAEGCSDEASFILHNGIEVTGFTSLIGQKFSLRIPLCKGHAILVEASTEHGDWTWGITKMPREMEITA